MGFQDVELLHAVQVECQGGDGVDEDAVQGELALHRDAFKSLPRNLHTANLQRQICKKFCFVLNKLMIK